MKIKPMKPMNNLKLLILGIAIVGIWRGVWMLMDSYLGTDDWTAWLTLLVGILLLSLMKGRMVFA